MNDVVLLSARALQTADLDDQARDFARAAKSENTRRAYASDLSDFAGFCNAQGEPTLPASPLTVIRYLTDCATRRGLKSSTITRRLSALTLAHRLAGLYDPTKDPNVQTVAEGIRNSLGTERRKKTPVLIESVRAMVATLPDDMRGLRDRALILVGFGAALRRSELAALTVDDVTFAPEGLRIVIRRSKTDQAGEGQTVGIVYGENPQTCPVRALREWMDRAQIEDGFLFLPMPGPNRIERAGMLTATAEGLRRAPAKISAETVSLVVKRAAKRAGLDPADFGGHSLRAGFATQAARAGVQAYDIRRTTRHTSEAVLWGYIREGELFRNNASGALGL